MSVQLQFQLQDSRTETREQSWRSLQHGSKIRKVCLTRTVVTAGGEYVRYFIFTSVSTISQRAVRTPQAVWQLCVESP